MPVTQMAVAQMMTQAELAVAQMTRAQMAQYDAGAVYDAQKKQ